MRYNPQGDPSFYWEVSDAWKKCQFCPCTNWKRKPLKSTYFRYWRDIEGAKKDRITEKDLIFEDWKCTNYRPDACLPTLYAMGERFVGLEQEDPAGFKCSPLPMGYQQVMEAMSRKKGDNSKKKKKAPKGPKEAKALSGKLKRDSKKGSEGSRSDAASAAFLKRLLDRLKNKPKLPPFVPGFITGPNLPYLDCKVGTGITPPPKCCMKNPCIPACYC